MTEANVARPARGRLAGFELLGALRRFGKGDFSIRMPLDLAGIDAEIAQAFNDVVEACETMAREFARIRDQAGREGQITQRVRMPSAVGTWAQCVDSVNALIGDLVRPTSEVARVLEAVANGNLSQTMMLEIDGRPLRGEFFRIGKTVNAMVDRLNAFASEVSRVAREVGTEGKLGGQAQVPGVAGTWKDLTDNVNAMAANLTGQVRNIAEVTTAVARGDLSKKITVDVHGEILELKSTINTMVDQLNAFASEVSRVAREVGTEGKLGGQAQVPGVAGTWKDLTDNVNQLAANLTTQVRAIAEVATAVTTGDLTRSIVVEARGEVAALKDNINEMIRNLADTTRKNTEQDWLKTNLANFSRMLQGQRDLAAVSRVILSELAPLVDAYQGVLYVQAGGGEQRRLELLASYACDTASLPQTLGIGESLVGQCAQDRKAILLTDVAPDYLRIRSALGSGGPAAVIVLPVPFEGQVKAVIELASPRRFGQTHLSFLEQLTESIGIVFNTIEANMRTESLLQQSQSLTRQLQRTNEELQEKAEQLALNSRYKSQFLANMSHELRTPLNSLLILARLLADNAEANLTQKQTGYAKTIHAAGTDLLSLINDILDLAKIESGTVTLDVALVPFSEVQEYVERTFRQVAHDKALEFRVSLDPALPPQLRTDAKRLQQILKNLLSNAFKFTLRGAVTLAIGPAPGHRRPVGPALNPAAADQVVAFAVSDTGIGIAADKQRIIFEAFQQADGTTSRQFGGTGLGLSISAELARLLGGQIEVQSSPGRGSTFTLFLPLSTPSGGDNGKATSASARPGADPQPPTATGTGEPPARVIAPGTQRLPPGQAAALAGRKVLLVDDDIRNIFALSSALEQQGMLVLNAENGVDGIEMLKSHPDTDIVLMDLMMPDMDGHDTIRIIRGLEPFRNVPIIGVTAKAMKGDRERCIEAGASDYIAKPVDLDQLLGLMQAWLPA